MLNTISLEIYQIVGGEKPTFLRMSTEIQAAVLFAKLHIRHDCVYAFIYSSCWFEI